MSYINWEYVIFESTSNFYEQRPKTTLGDICICSKCFPQVTKKNVFIGNLEVLWELAGT